MKWGSNYMLIYKEPKEDTKKTRVRFAFIPVETDSGWVWLERYIVSHVYASWGEWREISCKRYMETTCDTKPLWLKTPNGFRYNPVEWCSMDEAPKGGYDEH